jgi:hypothetical protein
MPKAVRSIGAAIGKNPLLIFIPITASLIVAEWSVVLQVAGTGNQVFSSSKDISRKKDRRLDWITGSETSTIDGKSLIDDFPRQEPVGGLLDD